jgi:hypothetical protein
MGEKPSAVLTMKRITIACTCLWIATNFAKADAELFKSATAGNMLATCQDSAERQQGLCLGFIEALAVRLAETREFCTYWPVTVAPLIAESLDALEKADKDASAWKVIEQRLGEKHLPPCK